METFRSERRPSHAWPASATTLRTGTLVELLHDEDRRIRKAACAALGALGDERALELLLAALGDLERGIQVDAAQALGALGHSGAIPGLTQALEDVRLRSAIPQALARIGDASVVPTLEGLMRDGNQHVRRNAAQALGTFRAPSSIVVLLKAMVDENPAVREAAENALVKVDEDLLPQHASSALPLTLEALQSEDWMIRASACRALRMARAAEALDPLLDLLSRESACGVLTEAEAALGVLGDARAVPALLGLLSDRGWDIRCEAIVALGRIGDARGHRPVTRALKDREAGVRRAAAASAARLNLRDGRTLRGLRKLLDDRVSAVRKEACHTLGTLRDAGARGLLEQCLRDVDPEVCDAARGAALAQV